MLNQFKLHQYEMFYSGLKKFMSDDRLRLTYQISLLRPYYEYYTNGILVNPTKLMMNKSHLPPSVIISDKASDTRVATEVPKDTESERLRNPNFSGSSDSNSDSDSDWFEITTVSPSKKSKGVIDYVPRDIPTCHFTKSDDCNNIFMRMESRSTCFMMIKSNTIQDFYTAIKASIWTSTSRGNNILNTAYKEYCQHKGGNVYLFFSCNGTGHISAFGELTSGIQKNKKLPEIWAESNRYRNYFKIRFILVKEIPMKNFLHLTNEEGMEMRRCRDTDKINYESGLFMAKVCLETLTANSLLHEINEDVSLTYF